MTPILSGRFQTRVFVLLTVGVIWTLLVVPLLPGTGGAPIGEVYKLAYQALAVVLVLGLAWECLYQFLMMIRWEKDWPALFQLLTGISEGFTAFWVLSALRDAPVPGAAFAWLFATTWLVTFLFLNTIMRVLFVRWRFRGGRIL